MIKCTLYNIHTSGEIEYYFDIMPRLHETIVIDGSQLYDNKEWQDFVGATSDNLNFEFLDIRTFQVCTIEHWIHQYNQTSIRILVDEFFGEEPIEE